MKQNTRELIESAQGLQKTKWGIQNHNPFYWLAILTEEIGKTAQALIKGDMDCFKSKLVSVAAVTCSWIDAHMPGGIEWHVDCKNPGECECQCNACIDSLVRSGIKHGSHKSPHMESL